MILDTPSTKYELIKETISSENNILQIKELCTLAGVSRSGYYRWLNAADNRELREAKDRADFELILIAYNHRRYSKGARGIYMSLIHNDPPVIMNLKKIRRLMQKYNLYCPIRKANPYRRMAKALRTNNVAPNILNREFEKYGPRTILLTDITYLSYNGVFAYLSTILDAYTKQVLSYSLSSSLEVDFVLKSIKSLLANHGSELKTQTLIHSDQGCHYTSYSYIDLIKDSNIRQSMSRRGNCWDNAPQESFYGHMKDEIDLSNCITFEEVKFIIDDWMDYYNNERYHWELAKLSPNEYYQFVTTEIYPLPVNNPPKAPMFLVDENK